MWLIGFWLTLNVNTTFNFIKLQEICEKIYDLFFNDYLYACNLMKTTIKDLSEQVKTEQSKENQKHYFNLIQRKIWSITYI